MEEKTDSGSPNDLARMDFGVLESQSSRLKVVLLHRISHIGSVLQGGEDVPSSVEISIVKGKEIFILVI